MHYEDGELIKVFFFFWPRRLNPVIAKDVKVINVQDTETELRTYS